ncbi:MAG: phenylacetate--CoA ligase family protein [Phycisphaeraceae bacterium]|nr:phenylacetate--CoA ligase family protein [Phycisphaeraceae bacterium]
MPSIGRFLRGSGAARTTVVPAMREPIIPASIPDHPTGGEPYGRFCATVRARIRDRLAHPWLDFWWRQCLAVDRMPRESLLDLRQARLQALVDFAVVQVPYYRAWAREAGFRPGDRVRLESLPRVTRDDIRRDMEAFQSQVHPRSAMRPAKTSGSSAEPLRFRVHPLRLDHSYAAFWRNLHRHGIRPGERKVHIWGRSWIFQGGALAHLRRRARNTVRDALASTLSFDAYTFAGRDLPRDAARIRRFRPAWIHGYVSAVYALARHVVDSGSTGGIPGLRLVVTESEKLYPFQRRAMEQAFGCPVVEHYGSVGFGNIAQQDPAGHLRVCEDVVWLERSDSGEAIVTSLSSFAFPFIRFALGDLIDFRPEIPPGLPYAVLREVTGRTLDLMPRPDGGHVHGVAVAHAIDPHMAVVRRYQVRQSAVDRITVVLEPLADQVPDAVCATIRTAIEGLFGPGVTVDVRPGRVTPAESGKFHWIRSEVARRNEAGAPSTPAAG